MTPGPNPSAARGTDRGSRLPPDLGGLGALDADVDETVVTVVPVVRKHRAGKAMFELPFQILAKSLYGRSVGAGGLDEQFSGPHHGIRLLSVCSRPFCRPPEDQPESHRSSEAPSRGAKELDREARPSRSQPSDLSLPFSKGLLEQKFEISAARSQTALPIYGLYDALIESNANWYPHYSRPDILIYPRPRRTLITVG